MQTPYFHSVFVGRKGEIQIGRIRVQIEFGVVGDGRFSVRIRQSGRGKIHAGRTVEQFALSFTERREEELGVGEREERACLPIVCRDHRIVGMVSVREKSTVYIRFIVQNGITFKRRVPCGRRNFRPRQVGDAKCFRDGGFSEKIFLCLYKVGRVVVAIVPGDRVEFAFR